ncbi:MAG TPA: D-alanyl-D-alanine carboxypeptidase [Blastocatellia bacterium]|nr:D-alanyl-D-alanine carboxypeptidase [Blastocatellia bacterium]
MKRLLLILILILLFPAQVRDHKTSANLLTIASEPELEAEPLQSLSNYKELLLARGHSLDDLGVVIESLDGKRRLADHNPDITFNPASVMKLATSLVALTKLGPDYRYRTNFLADGHLDTATRKLEGDLVVEGGTDPMFAATDGQEVAQELSRLGVSRITGKLRISGPFYYYARGYTSNLSPETSAKKLRAVIESAGIKIDGETEFGDKGGALLLSHYSETLAKILLYQNAHSSNAVAEIVGESVGGPQAIQSFLIKRAGLRDSEIYVGRASGLEFNRITPEASIRVLRSLLAVLSNYSLKAEDVMPIAGIDSGTLRVRLGREEIRGSVIAKTGTLVSMDNGVSTLVGIVHTKENGPLLFAIFNSAGDVNTYRRLQDQFIQELIAEEGGAVRVPRSEDALADETRDSIIQVLYKRESRASENSAD